MDEGRERRRRAGSCCGRRDKMRDMREPRRDRDRSVTLTGASPFFYFQ